MRIVFTVLLFLLSFQSIAQAKLRYPIVLVHGGSMGGSKLQVGPLRLGEYFQGLNEFFSAQGIKVYIPNLPTNASIGEQAMMLQGFLRQHIPPGKKVNIIAHSMGGLAARYLVSTLKYQNVASITSIAVPHRGTPLANWAWRETQEKGFWYRLLRIFGHDLRARRFLPELRTEYMQEVFNKKVPNRKDVLYYYVRGWAELGEWSLSPLLYPPHYFLKLQDHPMAKEKNDGLVPLSSQEWGKEIVTLKLDHLGQINHHTLRPSKEDISLSMFQRIIDQLQADGL